MINENTRAYFALIIIIKNNDELQYKKEKQVKHL